MALLAAVIRGTVRVTVIVVVTLRTMPFAAVRTAQLNREALPDSDSARPRLATIRTRTRNPSPDSEPVSDSVGVSRTLTYPDSIRLIPR